MISIKTKFLGATNTKGARILAVASTGKRLATGYAHELDRLDNHAMARNKLAEKMGLPRLYWNEVEWDGVVYHGGTRDPA